MTRDQEMVRQLQRRLPGWDPDGSCTVHQSKCCEFDEQEQLIKLHFCEFELVQFPSEVWQFLALQYLSLRSNQLSTLPAEVGNLTSLQTLNLAFNRLITLPAEVGNLTSLQTLDLGYNQLSTLPAEVGNLTSLQTLNLRRNQLSTLPAELWSLSSLQTLDLGSNELSALPAEVGNLTSLQTLDLGANGIDNPSILPAGLWSLSSLQILSLAFSQLSTLPPEVGNLTLLQTLDLSSNELSTLPAEVDNLTSLQTLELEGNPFQSPPLAIIEQGIPAILAYLRNQQQEAAEAAPIQLSARPITIFYCYAHEDCNLRDRIDKHLGVLKRLGQVTGWYDREIQAGTEWEREIEAHLSMASIILLLVSADFVSSDYCYGMEMQKALEMHEKGKARVLPILLRPVDWQDAPFAKLQMLPTGARPITTWTDPEEALEDVAKQIRAVVTTLRTHQS